MHRDDCPNRYQVRRQAERDAEDGIHRRRPYECDEANREYSRQIYYAEERREEQRQEERAAIRRAEERREQQRYEDVQAEQEYYAMLEQQAYEAEQNQQPQPAAEQKHEVNSDEIPW